MADPIQITTSMLKHLSGLYDAARSLPCSMSDLTGVVLSDEESDAFYFMFKAISEAAAADQGGTLALE